MELQGRSSDLGFQSTLYLWPSKKPWKRHESWPFQSLLGFLTKTFSGWNMGYNAFPKRLKLHQLDGFDHSDSDGNWNGLRGFEASLPDSFLFWNPWNLKQKISIYTWLAINWIIPNFYIGKWFFNHISCHISIKNWLFGIPFNTSTINRSTGIPPILKSLGSLGQRSCHRSHLPPGMKFSRHAFYKALFQSMTSSN